MRAFWRLFLNPVSPFVAVRIVAFPQLAGLLSRLGYFRFPKPLAFRQIDRVFGYRKVNLITFLFIL